MKKIILIHLVVIMLFNSVSMFGWGSKGHDVIASIAEKHLTRKTKKALDKILDGQSIVYYSSWMDKVQNSPDWDKGYNKTKTWHYGNVDKGMTYETMTKNPNGDVVTALEFVTKELTENFGNLTDSLKADYVKMVIHLVGDMHCPMHAGRLSDRGGNGTKIKWFGQSTNLHSLWDSKIIESSRSWSYTEWTEQLDRKDKKYRASLADGNYEDWLNETVSYAAEIYDYAEKTGKKEPSFSYKYVYDFSPLLENRLMTGGYRLAHVLNSIFD